MGQTICIVDDSKVSRMMISRIVREVVPDCSILEAADATEALAVFGDNQIDTAILDFNMPGMDGFELACKLIENGHDAARVAILTANIQDIIRDRVTEAGITFLEKPPSAEKLRKFLLPGGQ